MTTTERSPSPSLAQAGIRCLCPRCGRGRLYAGFLKVRPRCESCGLDLGFANESEGPAVFIIFIVGFIVVAAAAIGEVLFHPHPLVHLALWIPLTVVLSLALLRPLKATMIALHYRHVLDEATDR